MIYTKWAHSSDHLKLARIFLAASGLMFEEQASDTVLVYDDEELVGTGSLDEGVLKCIKVLPNRQGEGLLGTILTSLMKRANEKGYRHLFIYTKPQNGKLFEPFGFYTISSTTSVLLMENQKNGIKSFVQSLKGQRCGVIGSIVMNANPFTLGHRYLIEQALEDVEELQVFVLSSIKSIVPPEIRLRLVRESCVDLERVIVQESKNYLVSSATFPTYFLPKDTIAEANSELDIKIFVDYFAKELHITKRFLGTEPFSPITNSYNQEMLTLLPKQGVEAIILQRKETRGEVISASRVRALMKAGSIIDVRPLVPDPTWKFLSSDAGMRLFTLEKR